MRMLKQMLDQYGRVSKFAVTGGLAALVSYGTFLLLTMWLGARWYLLASVLGYTASFFVNFFLQKTWTFRNKETGQTHVQMGLFFANSLLNLALNVVFMYGLVSVFGVDHRIAQLLVIALLAVMNYTLYRLVIFKQPSESREP